jgi:hypothetical protein
MMDHEIRLAAFDWHSRQIDSQGDALPWALLGPGFELKGQRIPLLSPQGIFKPRVLELLISIRTSAKTRGVLTHCSPARHSQCVRQTEPLRVHLSKERY